MSIRDWPAAERPRERLLEQGSGSLSDAELLAIFLRTGVVGKSAVDLARHLLNQFGSLRLLLEADQEAFSKQLGLGPAKFAQLQAAQEMSRRHLAERARQKPALESPQAVREYLKSMLRHEPHEVFGCLFLDSRHQVLAFETLFRGSIDNTSVHPREVVKRALANNAAALILCHYVAHHIMRLLCPIILCAAEERSRLTSLGNCIEYPPICIRPNKSFASVLTSMIREHDS